MNNILKTGNSSSILKLMLVCVYYILNLLQKELLSDLPKAGQEGQIFIALRVIKKTFNT